MWNMRSGICQHSHLNKNELEAPWFEMQLKVHTVSLTKIQCISHHVVTFLQLLGLIWRIPHLNIFIILKVVKKKIFFFDSVLVILFYWINKLNVTLVYPIQKLSWPVLLSLKVCCIILKTLYISFPASRNNSST